MSLFDVHKTKREATQDESRGRCEDAGAFLALLGMDTNKPHEPDDSRDSDERTEADEARTDGAIRDLKARVVWPQQPVPASLVTSQQPPHAGTTAARGAERAGTPLRKLGVGTLGLIAGLLVGRLARFIVPGDPPLTLALLLGVVTLALAVGGVVIALVIDHRYLARRARTSRPGQREASAVPSPQPMPAGRRSTTGSALRRVGIGALGVIGGVLLALIVQDLLATAFLRDGTIPLGLAIVMGFLLPVFAVLGAVLAVVLDNRSVRRMSEKPTHE